MEVPINRLKMEYDAGVQEVYGDDAYFWWKIILHVEARDGREKYADAMLKGRLGMD